MKAVIADVSQGKDYFYAWSVFKSENSQTIFDVGFNVLSCGANNLLTELAGL